MSACNVFGITPNRARAHLIAHCCSLETPHPKVERALAFLTLDQLVPMFWYRALRGQLPETQACELAR